MLVDSSAILSTNSCIVEAVFQQVDDGYDSLLKDLTEALFIDQSSSKLSEATQTVYSAFLAFLAEINYEDQSADDSLGSRKRRAIVSQPVERVASQSYFNLLSVWLHNLTSTC